MNEYLVYYKIGSKRGKVNVEAHNKEQAGVLAGIQIRSIQRSSAEFTVILVLGKDEPLPYAELDTQYLVKKA